MNARTSKRVLLAVLTFGLFATLALRGATPTEAREWESEEHKAILRIPDDPYPWVWLPASEDWAKYGIIKGATRELVKLKTGKPANGEHGLLHLIVREAKDECTAKSLSDEKDVREMLMVRFGETESDWPEIDVQETDLGDDLPAVILFAKGKAYNTKIQKRTRCKGVMIIAVANSKMYFLRMYAWHTEYDDEGLETDLDFIETDFEILQEKKKPPVEVAPEKPPPEDNGNEEPAADEPVAEEIQLREYQLRIVKHAQLTRGEANESDGLILKFEDSDNHSYYSIYVYASKNGSVVNGVVSPPEDIKKWMTTDWWKNFTSNHPEGEIYTFGWPRIKAPTFITLPDISESERKHIAGGRKKTPIEPKSSDLIKKLKCVEKVKDNELGKKYKVVEPYRGILQGSRPRRGKETLCRFAWRTVNHSYRMFVMIGGEGDVKWGEAIRETLESLHFYKD